MRREGQPLWKLIFGNPALQEREERVLAHVANRLGRGASLKQVLQDDYVRRNLSRTAVDEVIGAPELMRAVQEHLRSDPDLCGPHPKPSR